MCVEKAEAALEEEAQEAAVVMGSEVVETEQVEMEVAMGEVKAVVAAAKEGLRARAATAEEWGAVLQVAAGRAVGARAASREATKAAAAQVA